VFRQLSQRLHEPAHLVRLDPGGPAVTPHSLRRMAGWTEELASECPELAACRRAAAAWSTDAPHPVNRGRLVCTGRLK